MSSLFPDHSPWYQGRQPNGVSDKPDTQNPPAGRVASDRDLEDAHHLLQNIINNLDTSQVLDRRDVEALHRDLQEIENLIYRSLR